MKFIRYLFIAIIIVFYFFLTPLQAKVTPETKLAGIQLGMTRENVLDVLGKPEDQTQVVAPSSGLAYDFMDYPSRGILVVLKDGSAALITISSPCKAKTSKGLCVGDKLSRAKDLYGKGVKESMGDVTRMSFPDYNLSIKGVKGTVIINEITIGNIKIY